MRLFRPERGHLERHLFGVCGDGERMRPRLVAGRLDRHLVGPGINRDRRIDGCTTERAAIEGKAKIRHGCHVRRGDAERREAPIETTAAVLGVSADPVTRLDRFRQKHGLTIPLLSDEKHAMLEAYGVWGEKTLYGRKFMGVKRTTVLIGADGRIAKLWQNVKVPGHAEEVLAAAKAL